MAHGLWNFSGHFTSREQTFHPRPKWALVPAFFAPGTRETFSPGWCLQSGLKVPAQRLLRSVQWQSTFSPDCRHQPGLKVDLYSRLEPPTGTKSPPTFSPLLQKSICAAWPKYAPWRAPFLPATLNRWPASEAGHRGARCGKLVYRGAHHCCTSEGLVVLIDHTNRG